MKVKHVLGFIILLVVTMGVVTLFSSKPTTTEGLYLLKVIAGDFNNELKEPVFAIADKKGNVFVADAGNKRIRVFDSEGKFLYDFGAAGTEKPLVYPYGIGIAGEKVIVADVGAGALYEYNSNGEYVKAWVSPGSGVQPAGVFVAKDKKVYVTDLAAKRIIVFSEAGQIINSITSQKVSLGSPQGLAVNSDGSVWVADGGNYNVKLLDPTGELKKIFDGGPERAMSMAKGLAIDKKGRIYVADTLSNVIRVFDGNGTDVTAFGSTGDKESAFKMPTGLSVDDNGKIYIADLGNNQVQVWAWK